MVLETFSYKYMHDFLVRKGISQHHLQTYCHRRVLQQYFVSAVFHKNIEVAKECLDVPVLDVNLGFINGEKSFNAMFYAVHNRDVEMVELLMNHGADCFSNGNVKYYSNPFMIAMKKNYFEILEVFIRCYPKKLVGTVFMDKIIYETMEEDTVMMGGLTVYLDTEGNRSFLSSLECNIHSTTMFRLICFFLQKYHKLVTDDPSFDISENAVYSCLYYRGFEDALFLLLLTCNLEYNTIDFIIKFALRMRKRMDRKLIQKFISAECMQILLHNEKHSWQKFAKLACNSKRACESFMKKVWKNSSFCIQDMYMEFEQDASQSEEESDEGSVEESEPHSENEQEEEDEEEREAAYAETMNNLQVERNLFEKTVVLEPFWGDFPTNEPFASHPYIAHNRSTYLRRNGLVDSVKSLAMHKFALKPNSFVSLQCLDFYFNYAELRTWMDLKKWEKIESMCLKPRSNFVVPAQVLTYGEEILQRNLIKKDLSQEEWKVCLKNRDKSVHFVQFFMEAFSDHMLHKHALAWAMASHFKRLSSRSLAKDLSHDIFRFIWRLVLES
jgi:hypothetical protein